MFHRRALFLSGAAALLATPAWSMPVDLRSADGVRVFADQRSAARHPRGTILLFHQAGTNHAEYDTIAPRLNDQGFTTLATDQRSGGTAFGQHNRTADAVGRDPGYAAALPDLEAALAHATQNGGKAIVWGSSYSAALVFVLAAKHPNAIAAVLAFSPGDYIARTSIKAAAAQVACPIFVTSATDPDEEAAAAAILAASPARHKRQFRAKDGVHGSSTLIGGRGADVWQAVTAFLDEVAPPG
jgi:alpha-beta hydrolase superfamily lysophospholipase